MYNTSDQALNQKEREILEPQKSFKKQLPIVNSINNVFQDLTEVLPPYKPHEMKRKKLCECTQSYCIFLLT